MFCLWFSIFNLLSSIRYEHCIPRLDNINVFLLFSRRLWYNAWPRVFPLICIRFGSNYSETNYVSLSSVLLILSRRLCNNNDFNNIILKVELFFCYFLCIALRDSYDELQASTIAKGIERGRLLLTESPSLASELDGLTHDDVSVMVSCLIFINAS